MANIGNNEETSFEILTAEHFEKRKSAEKRRFTKFKV